MVKKHYQTFREFCRAIQHLGITTRDEYSRRYKEDPNLPSSPHTIYKLPKYFDWSQNGTNSVKKGEDISLRQRALDWDSSFMTESMKEFLDGLLLGDGNLNKQKHTQHAHLRIGQKYKECADFFVKPFDVYEPSYSIQKRNNIQLNKFNGTDKPFKIYISHYYWTKSHPDFTAQYYRWYIEGSEWGSKKHVPEDVKITPSSVLIWYLGDGTLDRFKKYPTARFCTNGFLASEVAHILVREVNLAIYGNIYINKRNQICLSHEATLNMFDYIKPAIEEYNGQLACYYYKFITEDKRREIAQSRIRRQSSRWKITPANTQ